MAEAVVPGTGVLRVAAPVTPITFSRASRGRAVTFETEAGDVALTVPVSLGAPRVDGTHVVYPLLAATGQPVDGPVLTVEVHADGSGVTPAIELRDREAFLSMYRTPDADEPIWSLSADAASRLLFRPGRAAATQAEPVFSLGTHAQEDQDGASAAPQARVGINMAAPEHELDVAGTVRMQARLGGFIPEKFRTPQSTITPEGIKAAREIVADGDVSDTSEARA